MSTLQATDLRDRLFDNDNNPRPALIELLDVLNIPHAETEKSINEAMQKQLLIQGTEDWRIPENPAYNHSILVPLLARLGLIEGIAPRALSYDGVILLGGNLWSMRQRIGYMVKLWNQGCRFKTITIMTGEHPLDKGRYTDADLFEDADPGLPFKKNWIPRKAIPETEAEMISMILEQSEIPQTLCDIPRKMIVSKMDPKTGERPTTKNNAVDFFSKKPFAGNYLIISNQPSIGYQDAVFRTYLPDNITIETVGPATTNKYTMTMYLDRLTRWVYQEILLRKKYRQA